MTEDRTATQTDDSFRRLTADAEVAQACRLLAPSRSASMALEAAEIRGYRIVRSKRPGGFDTDGWLDRHRRLVELREGLPMAALVDLVAHEIRHVQQDVGLVLAAYEDLPLHQRLAGTFLIEADAVAFQVHVASQMARADAPAAWGRCVSGDALGTAADAYMRGHRKGGERIGATMAFSALAGNAGFLEVYAATNAEEIEAGLPSHGPGNLQALATRLVIASPAGAAYPDRPFMLATREFEAQAASRADLAPAMRAAA